MLSTSDRAEDLEPFPKAVGTIDTDWSEPLHLLTAANTAVVDVVPGAVPVAYAPFALNNHGPMLWGTTSCV